MIGHASRPEKVSVAIVGGGIGGLAAALSMLRRGFDVHVYEQAPMLGEIGAGVQVSPNASRVLHGTRARRGTGADGGETAGPRGSRRGDVCQRCRCRG